MGGDESGATSMEILDNIKSIAVEDHFRTSIIAELYTTSRTYVGIMQTPPQTLRQKQRPQLLFVPAHIFELAKLKGDEYRIR